MSWNRSHGPSESLLIAGQLSELCSSLGGPICAELIQLVRAGDVSSLVKFEMPYLDCSDINDLVYARQILAFYQKADFLELGIDRKEAAADRFVQSEQMCLETNRRFRSVASGGKIPPPGVSEILHLAQRKIADILGHVPTFEDLSFEFGPGANTNVAGRTASPRVKLGAPLECSSNMSPTVGEFLYETPLWAAHHLLQDLEDSVVVEVTVVPGKVVFVPKNAKTDRSIVVEPILNSFFQKGIGSLLQAKLKRSSVDLKDQTRNQRAALRGSIDGSLATIDLSMASDCLSRELVWSLLPPEWSELLDRLRTPEVTVSASLAQKCAFALDTGNLVGDVLRLEKFSSMGNGFTFELESLIFYSLAWASCLVTGQGLKDVCTYGDDIIVPVPAVTRLVDALSFCGFSVNLEKSFWTGSFRESCGADYFKGFDIRPFYLKTETSERILFSMHNWFLRAGEFQLASLVQSLCNPTYLIFGPDGFGDGHLIGNHSLRQGRQLRRQGWDGGYFDTYTLKPRSFTRPVSGDAILPSYSIYVRSGMDSPTDPFVVRGSSGYAKISIYTLQRSIFSGIGI